MIATGTPVERVSERVWVKREDLCSPYPGPGFAKIRGVYAHIARRPERLIGVLDTFHSKAGWAVAYVCAALGKQCLNVFPIYKADGLDLRPQQAMAHRLGAQMHGVTAGRSAILYHQAKRLVVSEGGYMMPNALKLPETVDEVAREVLLTRDVKRFAHVVISVSSGTIAAGVLRGLARHGWQPHVWLHMGYDRSERELRDYVKESAGVDWPLHIVNERWGYKEKVLGSAPFPCNPYYDLKTWQWLHDGALDRMSDGDVLFWNVGS